MSINMVANTSNEGKVHKITIIEGIKSNIANMSNISIIIHSQELGHPLHMHVNPKSESEKVYTFQKVFQVNSYYQ